MGYNNMLKYKKFGNQFTEYNGRKYHSKKEARYARELDLLRFCKDPSLRVVNVETQPRFPIAVNGRLICTYVADFRITYADGRIEVVDVKGFRTDVYKIKKKLVEAVHNIEIIEK